MCIRDRFINERAGYVGAHPVKAVRPAEPEIMLQLLDAAGAVSYTHLTLPTRDLV